MMNLMRFAILAIVLGTFANAQTVRSGSQKTKKNDAEFAAASRDRDVSVAVAGD